MQHCGDDAVIGSFLEIRGLKEATAINFKAGDVLVFRCAPYESTVDRLDVRVGRVLKAVRKFADAKDFRDVRDRARKHIKFFACDAIEFGTSAPSFRVVGRLDAAHNDIFRPKTLDLFLSLAADPFADREKPDDAGYPDKDSEDG